MYVKKLQLQGAGKSICLIGVEGSPSFKFLQWKESTICNNWCVRGRWLSPTQNYFYGVDKVAMGGFSYQWYGFSTIYKYNTAISRSDTKITAKDLNNPTHSYSFLRTTLTPYLVLMAAKVFHSEGFCYHYSIPQDFDH